MSAEPWLLATLLAPLACGALLVIPRARPMAAGLAPYAAWPALGAALLPVGSEVELPWLIMGSRLGVDALAPGFLVLTILVWSAVGFHLRSLPQTPTPRYLVCFFGAMAGNLGVIVALDPLAYYTAFGLLTFAAYGLIATGAEAESRRAGRIYLILALAGELAMLVGFMAVMAGAAPALALWSLYAGMGVKHGLLPFHVWLPVAHGIAPTPSSALLSGTILKAGLAGWLRFLAPEQTPSLAMVAEWVVVGGVAAALLGAVAGTLQSRPKMLLGYSSISQMGLLTAAVGAAAQGNQWEALLPLLVLMAFHHATVKAALFLGLGVIRRAWVWPVLLLLSLSLAAAPGTGGALAKSWLTQPATDGASALELLWLTSLFSSVLMARFLWLARTPQPHADARPGPFLVLAAAGLAGPWLLLMMYYPQPLALASKALGWSSAWPVLAGVALAVAAWRFGGRRGLRLPALPPGDVLVLVERPGLPRLPRRPILPMPALPRLPAVAIETRLRRLPTIGLLFFALLLAMVVTWTGLRW